jgi:hypothetical protein
MAHFAKLDENNTVLTVNVVNNNVLDPNNEEESGIAFLTEWSGGYSNWKQTSYNSNIRGVYAGIGYSYNEEEDIFVTPQPYQSWIRNGSFWEPPVAMPEDGNLYTWNEEDQAWVEFVPPTE